MSKPLRGDFSKTQIEELYKNCHEITLKNRIFAIKLVYSNWKVTEVAEHLGVSHKTIYNWIDLWNEGGIEKLKPLIRGKRREAYINKNEWVCRPFSKGVFIVGSCKLPINSLFLRPPY